MWERDSSSSAGHRIVNLNRAISGGFAASACALQIVGFSGMKKEELIVAIKEVKGIKDEPIKKADASVGELKKKIKEFKVQRRAALEAKDMKMATIYKRRISRLKKKSRRAAA